MDFFASNLQIMTDNTKKLLDFLENGEKQYKYVIDEQDTEWFVNADETKSYAVHDALDETQIMPNSLKREIIFVIGVNSLQEIKAITDRANENSIIVVYEPDAGFLYHVMHDKDMSSFRAAGAANVLLLPCPLDRLMVKLNDLFSTQLLLMSGNVKLYVTYFYRTYALATVKKISRILHKAVLTARWGQGNSIEDCLDGSTQTMLNVDHIVHSKDVARLKGAFADKPAIIVSAGPSLEKNIAYLHEAQGKAIIIATETILQRLLVEHIRPDFVTTIERVMAAYEYSYRGKTIPPEVTLVAPGVIRPEIFDEYPGNIVVPMRDGVREYYWWQHILGLSEGTLMPMGDSTAHLAFGLAQHLGANPIIFIGQDLAFGDLGTKCHASGTMYEEIGTNPTHNLMLEASLEVPGYEGGMVKTSPLWVAFKKWFEIYAQAAQDKNIEVINATEGGARIEHMRQLPLKAAIDRYCTQPVDVLQFIRQCPENNIDLAKAAEALQERIKFFKGLHKRALRMKRQVGRLKLASDAPLQRIEQVYNEMKNIKLADAILQEIYHDNLLFHNMQPEIINTFYKIYNMEEQLSYENVKNNIAIQQHFAEIFIFVLDKLLPFLEDAYLKLAEEVPAEAEAVAKLKKDGVSTENERLQQWSEDFYKVSKYGAAGRARYDMETSKFFLFKDQMMEYKLLDKLYGYGIKTLADCHILDAGCGEGRWLRRFIDWGAAPENLAGVDINEDIIKLARQLSAPGIDFRVGGADELPYADGKFDVIIVIGVLQHILNQPLRKKIGAELQRVLAPQGLIITTNLNKHIQGFGTAILHGNTRGLEQGELAEFFPGCTIDYEKAFLSDEGIAAGLASGLWGKLYDDALDPAQETHSIGIAVIRKPESRQHS